MRQFWPALSLAFVLASACNPQRSADEPREIAGSSPLQGSQADCPVDTMARHSDPVALVEEFVRRDAEGPMEREDFARAWLAGALGCAARTASDHHEIITTFRVEPLETKGDTARVLVRRTRAFEIAWDSTGAVPRLVSSPSEWVDTVVVVHTRYGWRIDRMHAGAHWFPNRALGEFDGLGAADKARLRQLAGRPST